MALELSLAILQENDNTGLQLTDSTGTTATGTATGWGVVAVEQNPPATVVVTDIVEDSDVQINLYDFDSTGPFADETELVWVLDPADLVSGGTAMGLADDELLDGIYDITYSLVDNSDHPTIENALETKILVDGKVRVKVYDVLRQIQSIYDCTNEDEPIYNPEYKDILVALLKYGMFRGMIANVCDSNETEILNILDTLERLTIND